MERKEIRKMIYQSDWSVASVFAGLEALNVKPERVVRAMRLLHRANVPAERLAGSLVLVFRLMDRGGPGSDRTHTGGRYPGTGRDVTR